MSEQTATRQTDTVVLRSVVHHRDTVLEYRETVLVLSPDSTAVVYRRDSINTRTATHTLRDTATRTSHTADTNTAIQTQTTAPDARKRTRPIDTFLLGMAAGIVLTVAIRLIIEPKH